MHRNGPQHALGVLALAALIPVGAADRPGEPMAALDIEVGRALFERTWVAAPASTDAADGLGPLYNARSCSGCHPLGRRSPASGSRTSLPTGLTLRLGVPDPSAPGDAANRPLLPEPGYGRQLQDRAIAGLAAEGRLRLEHSRRTLALADGETVVLDVPSYSVESLAHGPLAPNTRISPRRAPDLRGAGLIARIPDAAIVAAADPRDLDGDGISGRAALIGDPRSADPVLGRFGWKATQPSLDAQVQSAFHLDLGISTERHPSGSGDCTPRQTACRNAPHGGTAAFDGLEANRPMTDLVGRYVASLPAPRHAGFGTTEPAGARRFAEIGCAACHRPDLGLAARPQDFRAPEFIARPYTDLLLHDMGPALADGFPEGAASGREWRTPPLWGIGPAPSGGAPRALLHDGRARTLTEAILWHGGEAQASRDAFVALTQSERATLLRFITSL